jgi:adenylosuccinate lyase
MYGFEDYLSPFTWRYGSQGMRELWSEFHKRILWRKIWVALAEVQAEYGLVEPDQVKDLQVHCDQVKIERAMEIESEIHHDLMAELKAFAEQCPKGGGILHLGATSADIEDNADAIRLREALDLILDDLHDLMISCADQIDRWADLPCMGYTHLQPAEPTTLGYRLAVYAQDLLMDWEDLRRVRRLTCGKGFKGAVGSGASYVEVLGLKGQANLAEFETRLAMKLEIPFFPVTTQVYPRKQDYRILCALSGLGGSLYRFAFDLRLLQSSPPGELAESFSEKQVGSSAMPFKRNPVKAEKLDSLGRALAQLPRIAWDNAAHSLLERTLDDSANRRSILPEAFLMANEMLITARQIIEDLIVNVDILREKLTRYGPFAGIERVLVALTRAGADRLEMHERLREHSQSAWSAVSAGATNPLPDLVRNDEVFLNYLDAHVLGNLLDVSSYFGDSPVRAKAMAVKVRKTITQHLDH